MTAYCGGAVHGERKPEVGHQRNGLRINVAEVVKKVVTWQNIGQPAPKETARRLARRTLFRLLPKAETTGFKEE